VNELLQPDKLLNGEKVDARTLWASLESRQEFANWIKNRLADFIEGTDYTSFNLKVKREIGAGDEVFDKVVKNPSGGRPQTNYLLTLNTAKHICLLERSEPGRKIRQYLIEVEKLWKMRPTTKVVGAITDLEAAEMLLKSAEHFKTRFEQEQKLRAEAESRLAIAEPKAETLDKITATANDISVRELTAILAVPHLGQNNFFNTLRRDGYVDGYNRPYRRHIEAGLVYEKEYYVPQLDATRTQLRITQKGVAHFVRKYGRSTVEGGLF
jgi:phage anti-repressor protein/phage antirepressor YoqD-like protein